MRQCWWGWLGSNRHQGQRRAAVLQGPAAAGFVGARCVLQVLFSRYCPLFDTGLTIGMRLLYTSVTWCYGESAAPLATVPSSSIKGPQRATCWLLTMLS